MIPGKYRVRFSCYWCIFCESTCYCFARRTVSQYTNCSFGQEERYQLHAILLPLLRMNVIRNHKSAQSLLKRKRKNLRHGMRKVMTWILIRDITSGLRSIIPAHVYSSLHLLRPHMPAIHIPLSLFLLVLAPQLHLLAPIESTPLQSTSALPEVRSNLSEYLPIPAHAQKKTYSKFTGAWVLTSGEHIRSMEEKWKKEEAAEQKEKRIVEREQRRQERETIAKKRKEKAAAKVSRRV